jgi:hypothetical protein
MAEEKGKKNAPTVKLISAKTFDAKASAQSEEKEINRYILIELSCSNIHCDPCTYPNCQRFVREKREKPIAKSVRAVTTELKGSEQLANMLADEKNKKKSNKT